MEANKPLFYSGTSGMVLPVPNKLAFPPEFRDKSRLAFYASLFNSLEVNSSFYKIPMAVTVRKWMLDVPEDFRFTFKLFKEITHNKMLLFDEQLITRFMNVIDEAAHKKGCLLIQLPPGTGYNPSQLERLLACIRELNTDNGWKVAVEFRNRSWYREETYDLIAGCQAAVVLHDMPGSAPPWNELRADFVYLRLHGPTGNYRDSYSEEVLHEYAEMIGSWLDEGKTVYTYFNNTMGEAGSNVATINRYPGLK